MMIGCTSMAQFILYGPDAQVRGSQFVVEATKLLTFEPVSALPIIMGELAVDCTV